MKIPRLLAAVALAAGAGCNSLDNPLAGFNPFKTGHDARVFDMQTGRFEWPENGTPRPKSKAAQASTPPAATPAPKADDRPYDPQKSEFTDPPPGR